jgi:NAD(P)-dependent dehydrogenase (short-subunit alcohol dehydrogenase family)
VTTLVADAADEAASATMFSKAREALGGLDAVVLNVGIGAGFMLTGTSAEDWDRVMAINVRSHFLGCKQALTTMSEGGAIVLATLASCCRIATRSRQCGDRL